MPEPLFNKNPNKTITAYDLFGKKHKRNLNNFKFRASAYGILRKGNKILLQRHPLLEKFGLPGGGIEIDETIQEGLTREYLEETGIQAKPTKLITVEDSLFTYNGEDAHGILIFYEVEKIDGKLSTNDEDSAEVKYIALNRLTKDNIQRTFWNVVSLLKKTPKSVF